MIYCIDDVKGRVCKIGYTRSNVTRRLAELQTGSPNRLQVRCFSPGNLMQEKRIHAVLRGFPKAVLTGEWYRSSHEKVRSLTEAIQLQAIDLWLSTETTRELVSEHLAAINAESKLEKLRDSQRKIFSEVVRSYEKEHRAAKELIQVSARPTVEDVFDFLLGRIAEAGPTTAERELRSHFGASRKLSKQLMAEFRLAEISAKLRLKTSSA